MAERLTERHGKYIYVQPKEEIMCSNYCTSCGKADCDHIRNALEKLAHYEDLEEAGRLIELPCAVGDTVYGVVWENCHDGKCPWLDTTGKCTKGGISSEYCPQEVISWEFALEDLYNPRRFYLTPEEAEAKLKGNSNEEIGR